MGRQFRSEGGDYPKDVTRLKDRVPEPGGGCQDADSHLKAAYAAQNEHDAHLDQIDRAGQGKPYRDITNFVDNKPEPSAAEYWRNQDVKPSGKR